MTKSSSVFNSTVKNVLDYLFAPICLIVSFPLFVIFSVLIFTGTGPPIFFIQTRTGKNGKSFKVIKFRTMVKNAERLKGRYKKLNEANGPVFKIHNDPRFTKIGKVLSRTGLDELPQLINVLKGEMSIVGPRPLPVSEAKKLTRRQKIRELVKPGVTSSWVVEGSHQMSFKKWMELDADYVKNATFLTDIYIVGKTFLMILRLILKL